VYQTVCRGTVDVRLQNHRVSYLEEISTVQLPHSREIVNTAQPLITLHSKKMERDVFCTSTYSTSARCQLAVLIYLLLFLNMHLHF